MKIILLIVVIISLIAGGFYYLNSDKPGVVESLVATKPVVVDQAQILITPKGFVPEVLNVKKGTQVIWTNNDAAVHQIYSDAHPNHTSLPELASERIIQGSSYSFTFEKEGAFTYHDEFNPLKIRGIVIVK